MDKPSFEASLRALARRRAQEGHPEPSELAAYHAGELTEDQDEKIQDHLAICEECARLLLGFSEYSRFQPAKETDAAADQSAAAWQRFQARLREEESPAAEARVEAPSAPVAPLQRRRTPLLQRPGVAWAVAAVMAFCAVGLGMRVGSLQGEIGRLTSSQSSTPILDLSAGTERSGSRELFQASGNNPLLLLHLPGPGAAVAAYEAEVTSSDGETVVPAEKLFPEKEDGSLRLDLTRRPLPPGEYVVRVHTLEQDRPLVAEYPFSIP